MTHSEARKILNISENATPVEVKRAYRKMALGYHPDRNPNNPAAEEMFKQVSQAYQTLTRPQEQPYDAPQPKYKKATFYRKATFADIEYILFILGALHEHDAAAQKRIEEIRKTLKTMKNMHRFVNSAYLSALVGMLGMFVYNQIWGYDAPHIGLGVYPAIGVAVICAALTQDKMKAKAQQIVNMINELKQKTQ